MFHPRSPIRRGKSCRVPSCGETSTPQWGNGPDGPYTLCNRCYNKYRNRELKLYRDERTKGLSVVPGPFSYRVRHVGFHRRGGTGLQMDISRPIVKSFGGESRSLLEEPSRPVSAMKRRMWNLARSTSHALDRPRVCLIQECRKPAVADGPDGECTLCKPCFVKYTGRNLPLYQAPQGVISVAKRPGWRQVRVTHFVEGPDGNIDGRHPVVSLSGRGYGNNNTDVSMAMEGLTERRREKKRMRSEEMAQEKGTKGQSGSLKRVRTDAAEVTLGKSKAWRNEGMQTTQGVAHRTNLRAGNMRPVENRELSQSEPGGTHKTKQVTGSGGTVIGVRYNAITRRVRLGRISYIEIRKYIRRMYGLKEGEVTISYPDEENLKTWIRSEDDIEELLDVINFTRSRLLILDVERVEDMSVRGSGSSTPGLPRNSRKLRSPDYSRGSLTPSTAIGKWQMEGDTVSSHV